MPTNYTSNYRLNQWEPGDKVQRVDFNADNAKIDAALKAEADARAEAVASLTGQLGQKGNCQLYTTSYRGNGKYGTDSQNSLSFPKQPAVVLVASPDGGLLVLTPGQTEGYARFGNAQVLSVSWSGTTVKWANHQSALGQMNESGKTYRVIALLSA